MFVLIIEIEDLYKNIEEDLMFKDYFEFSECPTDHKVSSTNYKR